MRSRKTLMLRKMKRVLAKDPTNYKLLNMMFLLKHYNPHRDLHDEIMDAVAALPEPRKVKAVVWVEADLFEPA